MNTKIIYHNITTDGFSNTSINLPEYKKYFSNDLENIPVDDILDIAMIEILKYGGEIEFPQELLLGFKEDYDLDTFLLAPFNKVDKDFLMSCLYVVVPKDMTRFYKNIETAEVHYVYAIGKFSFLIAKQDEDGEFAIEQVCMFEFDRSYCEVSNSI